MRRNPGISAEWPGGDESDESDESDDHDYSDDHSEQTTNGGDSEDGTIHGETNRIYYGGGVDGLVAVRSGTRRE